MKVGDGAVRRMILVLVWIAAAQGTWAAADGKMNLAFGWEFRQLTVRQLIGAADEFAKLPIDGVELHLKAKNAAGEPMGSKTIMEGSVWTKSDWAPTLAELKELAAKRPFRSSFIDSLRAPLKRLDWRDDAAWTKVADNMRVAAWLAHEAGLPGLAVDPEDYSKCRQYFRLSSDAPYAELVGQVRRRGAEVFRGVFEEYPDITLLSYWLLSFQSNYSGNVDPLAAARDRGDLWPAFVNGILDVLPPTARIVDGDENAYGYEGDDFVRASVFRQERAIAFVAPENRDKYRTQVETAFGQYLDNYTNDETNRYYKGPTDGSRLRHLIDNYVLARSAARTYVWFWGEKFTWLKWANGIRFGRNMLVDTWESRLPGLAAALAAAADPCAFYRRQMDATPSFLPLKDGLPESRSTWQLEKGPQGVFSQESGELRLKGMARGCYSLTVGAISAGKTYGVSCEAKGPGVSLVLRWKKADGKWVPVSEYGAFDGDDPTVWRCGFAFARAPADAATLVVLLNAEGQSPDELATFRDVKACLLKDIGQ